MREGGVEFQRVGVLVLLVELEVVLVLIFFVLFDLHRNLGLSPSRIMRPLFMRGVGEEVLVDNRRRVRSNH